MTPDTITSFLVYYLRSLSERTRKEKAGAQYGIDWIIYNLGLARGWKPVRLPWLLGGPDELSKPKPEAEFGVDLSFLRDDGKTLVIFVLKDEPLTYGNWTNHDFDSDMRRAVAPDLTAAGFGRVTEVLVVVAYNKGDDARGITSFEQTARSLGTKVGDYAALRFERWNLTEIADQVKVHLLTPSLVPQSFFGHFSYLCAQVGDFVHGSDEWENQLVPNWRRFLQSLTAEPLDERLLRLIPVVLVIVRAHGRHSSAATGWLDLAEWAVLAAWRAVQGSGASRLRTVVEEVWSNLYLEELERFYAGNASIAAIEHGLEIRRTGTSLDAVANAFVGFWHIGRIGLLILALHESLQHCPDEGRPALGLRLTTAINTLVKLLQGNPSTMRPVLDIHHIELFLVWRALWLSRQTPSIVGWLHDLQQRLLVRRLGQGSVPFISGADSWEIAFERAADGGKSRYFGDHSSYLLLMVLELCCSLPEMQRRDELLREYYLRIVCGVDKDGVRIGELQPINLTGWIPPDDWEERILGAPVSEGVAVTVDFLPEMNKPDAGTARQINQLVETVRAAHPLRIASSTPVSAFVLACLKHQSPLPAEFWRELIFRSEAAE